MSLHEPLPPPYLSRVPVQWSPAHHLLLAEVAHKKASGKIKSTHTTITNGIQAVLVVGERAPSVEEVKAWVAWRATEPSPIHLRQLPTYQSNTHGTTPATSTTSPAVSNATAPTSSVTTTTNSGGRRTSTEFHGGEIPSRAELGGVVQALLRLQV